MAMIIFLVILIISAIAGVIETIREKTFAATVVCLIMAGACGVLLFISIDQYKNGGHKELVEKYNMTHKGDSDNGIYQKDNLVFKHREPGNSFYNTYTINDKGKKNLNLHAIILNYYFDFEEGTVQMIYEHLLDESKHTEKESFVTIFQNHKKLVISYHPETKTIDYRITLEKEELREKDNNDKTIYRKNNNYDKNKVVPELRIFHYNNDYEEFDKELVYKLFKENITEAKKSEHYSDISGLYVVDYCFGYSCNYNK